MGLIHLYIFTHILGGASYCCSALFQPTQQLAVGTLDLGASATKWKTTEFFRAVIQRDVVIPYRSFGTTYRSHLEGSRIQEEEEETEIDKGRGWGGGYKTLSSPEGRVLISKPKYSQLTKPHYILFRIQLTLHSIREHNLFYS